MTWSNQKCACQSWWWCYLRQPKLQFRKGNICPKLNKILAAVIIWLLWLRQQAAECRVPHLSIVNNRARPRLALVRTAGGAQRFLLWPITPPEPESSFGVILLPCVYININITTNKMLKRVKSRDDIITVYIDAILLATSCSNVKLK